MINRFALSFLCIELDRNEMCGVMLLYILLIICDEGSRREVLSRAAQTMAALARLKIILKDKNIRIKHKI